jgi:hypothetical protein
MSRQTSSFAQATQVRPVAGSDNEFDANVPWDWCGGLSVFSLLFNNKRHRS